MIDYKVAFHEGLTAAEKAKIAQKEIDSVFEQLNRDIAEVSDGKIVIERKIVLGPPRRLRNTEETTNHDYLGASNPTIPNSPVKELAKWSTNRRGYPCKISWEGHIQFCEDKIALEETLAELLRDPIVGQKLNALMHLEASEEDTNGSDDPEG